jgi:glycosyltransferase involved in cell wall biosynthesis
VADLMFFTPLLPFPTGSGSAIRASVALEVLAERHRVFVVNTGFWGSRPIFNEAWVRKRAAGYTEFPAQADAAMVDRLVRDTFSGAKFAGLYTFRLCMAPLALQVLARLGAPRPIAVLDLDDDELGRAERFLPLREASGDRERAARERAELPRLEVYYKMLLHRFDVTLLAAPKDRDAFAGRFPQQKFAHVRNVVREAILADGNPDLHRLLFVGGLDYLPNEDGIVYFCESILPLLRASGTACSVRVVGPGAPPRVRALSRIPEVQMGGLVADLAPEYAQAGVVIVPLRAGSGTRLKILEAFSHRRPVVSTTIGAEGLELRHEEHILIADTPEEFAAACARLMEDGALRSRLVERASAWLSATHSLEQVRAELHALFP